jgi:hypothetical protein
MSQPVTPAARQHRRSAVRQARQAARWRNRRAARAERLQGGTQIFYKQENRGVPAHARPKAAAAAAAAARSISGESGCKGRIWTQNMRFRPPCTSPCSGRVAPRHVKGSLLHRYGGSTGLPAGTAAGAAMPPSAARIASSSARSSGVSRACVAARVKLKRMRRQLHVCSSQKRAEPTRRYHSGKHSRTIALGRRHARPGSARSEHGRS